MTFSAILATVLAAAPGFGAPSQSVDWKSEVVKTSDSRYEIVLRGSIDPSMTKYEDAHIEGTLEWTSCYNKQCHNPEDFSFDFFLNAAAEGGEQNKEDRSLENAPKFSAMPVMAVDKADSAEPKTQETAVTGGSAERPEGAGSLWGLLLEAIIWGLAMLLTPCVFPMVPMTISFFLKQSNGRFKAAMFGLFIVLLYTVPISLIIGATWVIGGPAVSADIFNVFATHWIPNLLFFVVFMVFAASFFGAFEIVLPSKWTNSANSKSGKGGLLGVFFFALTLVLVSFSCTGPIVGTILIKSVSGEVWTPMITMLVFSVTFALPFTILALFPSLMKKLPKSGGWLNSVKVVLGFVEIALGLKFLSTADQVYQWGILPRGLYISIWIVCAVLLGLYFLGKIRFANDSEVKHVSVTRLFLAMASFVFALYLLPGLFGAPLKALSGYFPPMDDSVRVLPSTVFSVSSAQVGADSFTADFEDYEDALKAARESGKPVFVDFTGYGCVNCREMEANVLNEPEIVGLLKQYVVVELHVDGKKLLPESKWIVNDAGKTLKTDGQIYSYIGVRDFGVNAQPTYILLSSDGTQLAPARGYDLSVDGFREFLKSGLDK